MQKLFNVRTAARHSYQEFTIKRLDTAQDLSRAAILERAVQAAVDVKNWKEIQLSLSDIQHIEEAPIFSNFQAKYSEETEQLMKIVRKDILTQLNDSIKVLQNQYLLLLLQANYIQYLQREKLQIKTDMFTFDENMDMPEMAKTLCQMMLTAPEAQELKEIKNLMIKWKSK